MNLKKIKHKYLSLQDFVFGGLFDYVRLDHEQGLVLYKHANGSVKYDFMQRDYSNYKMKARHSLTVGETGSGKSFFAKLRIVQNSIDNCKIFNLDLQGDYMLLFDSLGGQNLNFSDGIAINPLQIINYNSSNPLGEHLAYLVAFFATSNTNNESFIDKLLVHIYDFYQQPEYEKLVNSPVANEEYPIFTDLYNYLVNKKADEIIINFIHKFTFTIYGTFFNNKTNIELNNRLINFVVMNVNSTIKNTIYFQIFSLMSSEIYKFEDRDLVIEFDEAHNLFNNTFSTDFVVKTIMEARKFQTQINLATQSPEQIPKVVIDQLQTKATFRIADNTLVAKIFDVEEVDLPNLSMFGDGKGIISIDNNIYPIDIYMTASERVHFAEIIEVFDGKKINV